MALGGLRWHSEVAIAKGRGGGWQRWQHEGKGDAEERGTRGKGRWQREERPAEVVARREPQGRLEVTGRREVTGRGGVRGEVAHGGQLQQAQLRSGALREGLQRPRPGETA